jgi:hypothetical protein
MLLAVDLYPYKNLILFNLNGNRIHKMMERIFKVGVVIVHLRPNGVGNEP